MHQKQPKICVQKWIVYCHFWLAWISIALGTFPALPAQGFPVGSHGPSVISSCLSWIVFARWSPWYYHPAWLGVKTTTASSFLCRYWTRLVVLPKKKEWGVRVLTEVVRSQAKRAILCWRSTAHYVRCFGLGGQFCLCLNRTMQQETMELVDFFCQ